MFQCALFSILPHGCASEEDKIRRPDCQKKTTSANPSDNRRNPNLQILKETRCSGLSWCWTLNKPPFLLVAAFSSLVHNPEVHHHPSWKYWSVICPLRTVNTTRTAVLIIFTWSYIFNLSGIVPWRSLSHPNWAPATKGAYSWLNGERDTNYRAKELRWIYFCLSSYKSITLRVSVNAKTSQIKLALVSYVL